MKKSELDAIIAPILQLTEKTNAVATAATNNTNSSVSKSQDPQKSFFSSLIENKFSQAVAQPFKDIAGAVDTAMNLQTIANDPTGQSEEAQKASKALIDSGTNLESMGDQIQKAGAALGKIVVAGFALHASFEMINNSVKYVFTEAMNVAKDALKQYSDFQLKSLAANIKPVELFGKSLIDGERGVDEFQKNMRSTFVDFNKELLKFRELGVTKLNADVAGVVDKMLFTGQKVGSLATFLSNNATAIGLNTDEASMLAVKLSSLANTFELQQDTLLDVALSMKELANNIEGLSPGAGKNITELATNFAAQFGTQYTDSIKSILTTLVDPSKASQVIMMGLQQESTKALQGTLTAQEFVEVAKKITSLTDSLGKGGNFVDNFAKSLQLQGLNISTALVNDARQIERASIREGEARKDVLDGFYTFKDALNAVNSEAFKFASIFGDFLSDPAVFKGVKDFLQSMGSDARKALSESLTQTSKEIDASRKAQKDYEELRKNWMALNASQEGLEFKDAMSNTGYEPVRPESFSIFGLTPDPTKAELMLNRLQNAIKSVENKEDSKTSVIGAATESNRLLKSQAETMKNWMTPDNTTSKGMAAAQLAKLDDMTREQKKTNYLQMIALSRRPTTPPYELRTG